ncbi:hypothetical protein GPJ56_010358 [Histomonas meleagridis]|uniref:uncharacterized protein n=1 Tax=Histomonas meleagridis TaxID=135588 RepID=UPI00355A0C95|nr:hypothetical protein GPJ56_010358 [Histomonas meleagridis]KAH0806596.1 hypothetical protein GO595_000583 [Histomonas meleagridis]
MAPDLAKQLIKNLLQEIVEDLTATEGTNDDYSGFSAIAWIESPCRNYATTLQGIVKLNPESVLSVLLFRLREHCKLFLNINSVPSPIKIKKLLVLCELILHSPEIVLNAKSKESLNIILNMQLYNKDIAMAKQMIVESLFEVARYLVLHGANPVPTSYQVNSSNDLANLFKICSKLNYTTATFKSILRLSQTVVPSLPIELRPKLVNKLYRTIVKFYTSNTKEYRELLLTGVDEAQKLMDILLSWKSNDIDNISLYGVLMPLCTRDLKLLNTKKGPFVSIMNTLSNFKQTKENHRTPISLAILEITNCVSLVSANENSLFHAFDEFLFSYKGKFEAWIFKDRKKQYFTGSLLGYFLPRYAALEFEKRQKTDGPACKKILQLVEKTQGYSCYVLFLRYIYDHYKQNKAGLKECEWQLMTLLSNKFQKAMLHLQTRKTDQEDFQRHSDFVRTAVQFLVGYNYKFSRYCMLSLYGNPDPSLRHANKQMDAFIHSNCGFDQIGAILASALPVYIQHFISNSAFLVKMYRAFLTLTDKWVNQLKDLSGKEAIKLLTDISITSKAMTEKAISINSPNLSSTPFLFYRFLKWAFMVMESTNSQQYLTPNHDFIKLNMSVILMLYSYSVDPIINSLNELMGVKLRSYGINFTYEFPLKDISPNDDVIIPAVKSIFLQWVSSTIRQIQAEEIAASDNPSQTLSNGGQFSFEPSREKISLMTIFLCRYIYFLSTVSFSSNESQPAEVRFIVSALKYIDKTNSKDIAFTKAFRNTNKESLPKIISNCKDLVLFKYQNLDFDNKIFWWNIIDLVTYTIESGQLENQENQEAVVNDIEEMIKIFISMVQINAFGENL